MSECYDCIWNSSDGCTEWECDQVTRAEAKKLLNIVRCKDCRYWQTEISYIVTGRCKHPDHNRQITNKNYYCADGREKDG